ncbi:hypothetical protein LCGC14_2341870 [marine sediment metagenome]|uniref:Uncharacterized protein n=1 Tax=marine sediment metagenome TaxID=412755 RepID=A0A0F9CBQ9_9ZZZZ
MGLRICETIPDWIPPKVNKKDINGRYHCRVELKSTDPIEEDRLRLLGRSLVEAKQIDHLTNLTKYQGYTEEEGRLIISRIMVDMVTILSPEIAQILGIRFAEKHGLKEYVMALQQQNAMQGQMQGLNQGVGSQGGPPRTQNIQTTQGAEQADLSLTQRGERRSPGGI